MSEHFRRVGLLIPGVFGMTGSATALGLGLMRSGSRPEEFGITSGPAFAGVDLPGASEIVLGGWEVSHSSYLEAFAAHEAVSWREHDLDTSAMSPPFEGVRGPLDFEAPPVSPSRFCESLGDGAEVVGRDIRAFKSHYGLTDVVVVYCGSPSRPGGTDESVPALNLDRPASASLMYAYGALLGDAHFIDFTPSDALEYRELHGLFADSGLRIAGRDGSTGQTLLKLHLAEVFFRRGMLIDSWFSTNLIGNHDGFVLSHPQFSQRKIEDKLSGLSAYGPKEHAVDIHFLPSWGDRKESWDAVELRGWMGTAASLRLNWRGVDSFLAAPLILDLCRLIVSLPGSKKGLVTEFGYFFKRPIGVENLSQSELWTSLLSLFPNQA